MERGVSVVDVSERTATWVRPAVLDAIPAEGHVVIEASAGTGKTFALEHLVADLVIAGTPLESILVVTFTEKATREMRARVRATLARAAAQPSLPPATAARLREAELDFDRAPIFTIHGFCQRVLSEHALRTRQPIRHTLVEPRRAFGRAFRDELRVVLAETSPLRRVVTRVLEDMDGTRLESALFHWHEERGAACPPWSRERFRAALQALEADDFEAEATIRDAIARRDIAARLLEQLAALRRIAEATRGDELEALVALDRWGRHEPTRGEPNRRWVPARLDALPADGDGLRAKIARLLDTATSPFGVLVHELLPRVRARLDREKRRRGEIDFDDMLLRVRDVIVDPQVGPPLVQALRAQYATALVDEFQDTDAVQWDIFHQLFVTPVAQVAPGRLYVIGDPKQAIYGFRNADVFTYRHACDVLQAGREPVPLDTSFRSTEPLLELLNDLFERDFFEGPIQHGRRIRCGRPDRRLVDARGDDAAPLVLFSPLGQEEPPRVADVRAALAERIAEEIQRIAGPPASRADDPRLMHVEDGAPPRPLGYGDVFVLTRNAREAEPVAAALARRGIPHVVHRQDGIFDTPEVQDVLDVLRAVATPDDTSARLRAWLTPFFGVPLDQLTHARALDGQHPLYARLHQLREHARRGDGAGLLRALIEESGLARRLLFQHTSLRALATYRQVLEILLEESGGRGDPRELVALLESFIDGRAAPISSGSSARIDAERSAVQVLTMHRSKGLEASVVFVAGGFSRSGGGDALEPRVCHREGRREAWLDPVPSHVADAIAAEARQEDQRLLYVALTRARARVYLPYFGPPPEGRAWPAGAAPFERLQGPVAQLDRRLADLLRERWTSAPVVWEPLAVAAGDEDADEPSADERALPDPSEALARAAQREAGLEAEHAALRLAHAGFLSTSYSRMKAGAGRGYVAQRAADADVVDASDELVEDVERADADRLDVVDAPQPDDALPGGAAVGVFLHAVLEDLHFPTLREASELASWAERPEVRRVFERHLQRGGLDEALRGPAEQLIFDAMRRPVVFADQALPEGFCMLDAMVREMSFHFPIPERWHPRLDEPSDAVDAELPYRIGRGVVRGFIDVTFRHAGKTYWLDWKSDRLLDASPAAVAAHVDANYRVQARLYTLGVLRWLGIRDEAEYDARFGGLVYAFLRAMRPEGASTDEGSGVHFERPAWEEIVAWEAELRESEAPWGYPLETPGATP